MDAKEISLFAVLAICVSFIIAYFNVLECIQYGKEHVDLMVCILSARNNFKHRAAIRQSWLNNISTISDKSVVAKFVIGTEDCSIHPQDRLDPHSCREWDVTLPESDSDLAAFRLKLQENHMRSQIVHSIYVKVMHDLILKRLGLAATFPLESLQNNESIDVTVYDAVTEDEVTSAHFSASQRGTNFNGYRYRPVQELLFPKGYEFSLVINLTVDRSLGGWKSGCPLDGWEAKETHQGLVILEMINEDGTQLSVTEQHYLVPAVSFMFSVHDVALLKRHITSRGERNRKWSEEMTAVASQLQEEEVRYGDLMMIHGADVYRNLPQKLLASHQWIHQRFQAAYILKTDDDCFIDLPRIVQSLPSQNSHRLLWWGSFRKNWQVERFGKWRESKYSGSVYPQFACGSGSVVSNAVHTWLVHNQDVLTRFQGEDTSMGIWLSPLTVDYIQDDRWQCDMSCHRDMLSLPELTPDRIIWLWNNSKHCPSPCQSCGTGDPDD